MFWFSMTPPSATVSFTHVASTGPCLLQVVVVFSRKHQPGMQRGTLSVGKGNGFPLVDPLWRAGGWSSAGAPPSGLL
jgi:hypothetical protein